METRKKLIIVGTSQSARTVYKFVKTYDLFEIMGFAVNNKYRNCETFQELPVFDLDSMESHFDKENDLLFVAIQWNQLNKDRRGLYEKLKSSGYKFATIISPHAIVHTKSIGSNCWISDQVVIDSDAIVGNNVFIKVKACIGNYTKIEDHCFIGANSYTGAACKVGEQTFIGASATVFDQIAIGEKCIIGGATIIKRNIPPYSLVKTNSANQTIQNYNSETIEGKLLTNRNIR